MDLGPITKGGWCPFDCLSLGPHGCLEAVAPKSQSAAAYEAGRGASQLTEESTEVPGGDVTTSGYRANETVQ